MKTLSLSKKEFAVLALDLILAFGSYYSAYLIRFDAQIPSPFQASFWKSLPLILAFRLAGFYYFGTFRSIWKYVSINELQQITYAITISSLLSIASIGLIYHFQGFPRSVFLIDWLLLIFLIGGLRISKRLYHELTHPSLTRTGKNLLIVGAGDAGELILREIKNNPKIDYTPVGFIDDNKSKVGRKIHGVEVLGTTDDIQKIIARKNVEEILIAIPSARGETIRKIVEKCRATGVAFKILPGIENLIDGKVTINQIRQVNENDLLRREPVELDIQSISREIRGKRILVTGAGGSIGAELCRQILKLNPEFLILFERSENSLYFLELEIKEKFPDEKFIPIIGDILDINRLERVFATYQPHLVFHSAAYKHVPMMELNPLEALKNNILGTKNVADLADKFHVGKFVMISTDKAVRPVSIMGASKRAAEIYIQSLNQKSQTAFITVRFGNVLNSEGSVIPIFKEQIRKGGPVTVTHPDVYRYFMTIPEATQLVLQAGTMGKGGEIYLLDMGKPVKILDLAIDLITLSGFKPWEDIDIIFTGLRPGEKLYEELLVEGEGIVPTHHKKIMIAKSLSSNPTAIDKEIQELKKIISTNNIQEAIKWLQRLIPEYQPSQMFSIPKTEKKLTDVPRLIRFEEKLARSKNQ